MRRARVSRLIPVLLLAAAPAHAATQNVIFDANVAATCTLAVLNNGTMAPAADLKSLSSRLPGGAAASLSLSTTGGVNIGVSMGTVDVPPGDDNGATNWEPKYSVAGAHGVPETSGTEELDGPGQSTVTVHLVGTKSGNEIFGAGAYQATVTVTCE